jgi:hypothetical protein
MTYSFITPTDINSSEAEPMAIAIIIQVVEHGLDQADGSRVYVCASHSIYRMGDRYTVLDKKSNELFQFQASLEDAEMMMRRHVGRLQRLVRRSELSRVHGKQKNEMLAAARAFIEWGTKEGLL